MDMEGVTYMGEASPGIGRWAIVDEGSTPGVCVFEMPHSQRDQSLIDLSRFWFFPHPGASESISYLVTDDVLHVCGTHGYFLVRFDPVANSFTELEPPFDRKAFSGKNRQGLRGCSITDTSLFRIHSTSSKTSILEIDYRSRGLDGDQRIVSRFSNVLGPDQVNPKVEGGVVWNMDGDPEDCFYIVGERRWYKATHTFRRFRRVSSESTDAVEVK